MPDFRSLEHEQGYLPLEDYGLIGDGSTAALVGRDGALRWMCLPRFDSPPLFCGILDRHKGGSFTIAPANLMESRQYYLDDTAVLVTEMKTPEGVMRLTDMLALQNGVDLSEDVAASRRELLRSVEVISGTVTVRWEISPRGGALAEPRGGGLRVRAFGRWDLNLRLAATIPLNGLSGELELKQGESAHFLLRWGGGHYRYHAFSAEDLKKATIAAWTRWMSTFCYEGPQAALIRRSAITLKQLEYLESGAIVAAPTSSLPEAIGGKRNWDYRFSWIRDAAFTVYALHRIGFSAEAAGFLGWVLDAVERGGRPKVLYTLDGLDPSHEVEDSELEGYRSSKPVRWGNGAATQVQHDVYGEILDCAFQWAQHHGEIDPPLWQRLQELVEAARRVWRSPDQGIWEVRTEGRPFTYSSALCQVALNRAARLAKQFRLPGDCETWFAEGEAIRQAILEESWDPAANSLTEHLGGGGLDASLLALPVRRVVPADHPRMIATTEAVSRRLNAGKGLLFRYLPHESPDGVQGEEGAFLLCSFWLVDNLAGQGKLDQAGQLYESLCGRANELGLLPEQIDPVSGRFLGNYPQGFSHVGLISSGVNLARRIAPGTR